ncbi:MAG: ATP-binding protein [Pseudomonadota bacterium]
MPLLKLNSKHSLTRTTLIKMGIRIAIIIIAVTLISYSHVMSNLESQVVEQLEKYIIERGQRESSLFTLSEDNHAIFKQEFLSQLKQMGNEVPIKRFNQIFQPLEDGTIRMPPEFFTGFRQPGTGIVIKELTGFIGQNVTLTDEIRRRIIVTFDMLTAFSPAWASWADRFPNLYVSMPEKIFLVYYINTPWGLDAPADIKLGDEVWVAVADKKHNPTRETVWTAFYYDSVAKDWMVSCATPVDVDGQHLITIGHDILLNKLFERTVNDRLEGTYNLIFREDGRLIVHPDKIDEIREKGGEVDIPDTGDPHLINLFEQVKNIKPGQIVLENSDEYLAVTKINGPDWYFVTVYPKSLLAGLAFDTARFILILGMISLLIEIIVLFLVLRKQVAQPLQEFLGATQKIAEGHFGRNVTEDLPLNRRDEIGRLAQSFYGMAGELKNSFDTLDAKVVERTAQLNSKVEELTRTRNELVQSEKMASLGRLVAGFAHELNTPIGVAVGTASVLQKKSNFINQLLEQEEVDEEELLSALAAIDQSAKLTLSNLRRAAGLVSSFKRTAVDQTSEEVRPFEVKSIIEDVINTLHNKFKRTRIEIQVDCSKDLVVYSIPGSLEQILTNLMINSLIHGFEEGKNGGIIRFAVRLEEKRLHIDYSDTGKGIAPDALKKIFEPFFTTNRAQGGSGLGMYICYNLVTSQLNGTMTCESSLGKGVLFRIEFPVAFSLHE